MNSHEENENYPLDLIAVIRDGSDDFKASKIITVEDGMRLATDEERRDYFQKMHGFSSNKEPLNQYEGPDVVRGGTVVMTNEEIGILRSDMSEHEDGSNPFAMLLAMPLEDVFDECPYSEKDKVRRANYNETITYWFALNWSLGNFNILA